MSIRAEGLSKKFQINNSKYNNHTTLRDLLGSKIMRAFQKNQIDHIEKQIEIWVLKDLNFEIEKGDKVALIGKNGAGKSTLLKVLSRILSPSAGRVTIDGKISSLIEVGTGFHHELDALENIYLSGIILGMSKYEIKNKIDEIVSFAEIEQYINTPVKRYSSGMQIRLAFSVAVHLISDILILDEVLAVGDQKFQAKCINKINEITSSGKTLLFVSHDVDNINKMCNKGICLHNGEIIAQGKIADVNAAYNGIL